MTLQETINLHLKNAILTSNTEVKSLLRVVIGEMNREGKIVADEKVISIVKKMIDNAKIVGNLNEVTILETYLPKQLTEDELNTVISALIYNNNYTIKDMGKIMGDLKSIYSGKYDGKLASTLIKSQLS
jgi:uncharacterized protein YqeY